MNREDAYRIGRLLNDVEFEERFQKGKGATYSNLVAYAKGMGIINKLDELLEFMLKVNLIHIKLIGKREYYRLGES